MHTYARLACIIGATAHDNLRQHHYYDDDYYYSTSSDWAWVSLIFVFLIFWCCIYAAMTESWWSSQPVQHCQRPPYRGMHGDGLVPVATPVARESKYNLEYPGQIMFRDVDGDYNMLRLCGNSIEWHCKSPRRGDPAMRLVASNLHNLSYNGTHLMTSEADSSAPLAGPLPPAVIERLTQMTANANGQFLLVNPMQS